MAIIATIYKVATREKGVVIAGLPTRGGRHMDFWAFGPKGVYKALEKWKKKAPAFKDGKPKCTVINFRLAMGA